MFSSLSVVDKTDVGFSSAVYLTPQFVSDVTRRNLRMVCNPVTWHGMRAPQLSLGQCLHNRCSRWSFFSANDGSSSTCRGSSSTLGDHYLECTRPSTAPSIRIRARKQLKTAKECRFALFAADRLATFRNHSRAFPAGNSRMGSSISRVRNEDDAVGVISDSC